MINKTIQMSGTINSAQELLIVTGIIISGVIIGAITSNLPIVVTTMGCAGLLAAWFTFQRPELALGLFFCGIIMMSDAVSLSAENCFVIPDMDIIQGLPSALTTFFLMICGISMAQLFCLKKETQPTSFMGLVIYTGIILLALLTGLFKHNTPDLLRVDFMSMLFPVLCFYLCLTLLNTRERIEKILILLFSVTAVKSLILMVYYLIGRGWMYQLDGESSGFIVTLDSADLLFCITFLLIALHLLARRDLRGVRAFAVITACIPMLFAVIFSYRRAQWIGLTLSLGLLVLGAAKPIRLRIGLAFVSIFCMGILFLLSPSKKGIAVDRISTRVESLFDKEQSSNLHHKLESQRVISDLAESPVLGFGLGGEHSGFTEQEFNTIPTNIVHQTFLYIWMKTGIPGLLFFIWATILYGKRILQFRKTHLQDPAWGLVLPLAASMGLWLAMFLTSPIPWYMHQTFFKAFVAATAVSLMLQTRAAEPQPEVVS
jgi:O-antigen ligase